MIIENGKRYVRADGEISGVIEDSGITYYPHLDPDNDLTYTGHGRNYLAAGNSRDLVSEYLEPSPQYGPWIPWTGGECPVADGTMGQVQFADESRDEAEVTGPDSLGPFGWARERGCYQIIYYRVLIEEPEATVNNVIINVDGFVCGLNDWGNGLRLAKLTVQGDNIKAEWAPKGEVKE